jgi:hypothetical protein
MINFSAVLFKKFKSTKNALNIFANLFAATFVSQQFIETDSIYKK